MVLYTEVPHLKVWKRVEGEHNGGDDDKDNWYHCNHLKNTAISWTVAWEGFYRSSRQLLRWRSSRIFLTWRRLKAYRKSGELSSRLRPFSKYRYVNHLRSEILKVEYNEKERGEEDCECSVAVVSGRGNRHSFFFFFWKNMSPCLFSLAQFIRNTFYNSERSENISLTVWPTLTDGAPKNNLIWWGDAARKMYNLKCLIIHAANRSASPNDAGFIVPSVFWRRDACSVNSITAPNYLCTEMKCGQTG